MKIYAIHDKDLEDRRIGYLFYYESSKSFIIELCSRLDEWEAPVLFQGLVKNGVYTVSREYAYMWVSERVIPSGRQNIGSILKNAKLNEYDEMSLLHLSKGICSQDNCYICEIDEAEIEEDIVKRRSQNISESYITDDRNVMCLFYDNTVRKINLEKLAKKEADVKYLLNNDSLLDSIKVTPGGYAISFAGNIEITKDIIRDTGELLSISANDIIAFARKNVIDTTKACEIIECTRQNISYLVKREKISPIIRGSKENLYTRGSVEQIGW